MSVWIITMLVMMSLKILIKALWLGTGYEEIRSSRLEVAVGLIVNLAFLIWGLLVFLK